MRSPHAPYFYRALGKQIERAGRGEVAFPFVPPARELTYVDGFLVWNGVPVWWSGESGSRVVTERLEPGLLDTLPTRPFARPERPRTRRRWQRWLGLW